MERFDIRNCWNFSASVNLCVCVLFKYVTSKGSSLNIIFDINPLSANPKKWSNTLKNSSAVADELFECIWPFMGFVLKGLGKFKRINYYYLLIHQKTVGLETIPNLYVLKSLLLRSIVWIPHQNVVMINSYVFYLSFCF